MVTTARLRVAFFGTPEFAVPSLDSLLHSRHTVAGVVTQPDRPRGRGHKPQASPIKLLAEQHRIPILQPERLRDSTFLDALREWRADLGVVAAYGKILTDDVLGMPPQGLVNVHASLLPRYRGAAPIHRAVMAGEKETGVTVMRVVKALDAGPMLTSASRPIAEHETSLDVEQDIARLGAELLIEACNALAEGGVSETPQREEDATYARKIEKADGVVDWSRPAKDIHNQIRGLYPWPHAFSDLNGERTILLRSEVEPDLTGGHAEPGVVLDAHGDELRVQTGNGVLRVLWLQREGRRPMTTREFLAGRRIDHGTRFTRTQLTS